MLAGNRKKGGRLKRFPVYIMIFLMLFFSCVLVPKAHAEAISATISRLALAALSPAALKVAGGVILAVGVGAAIGYILLPAKTTQSIVSWFAGKFGYTLGPPSNAGGGGTFTAVGPSGGFYQAGINWFVNPGVLEGWLISASGPYAGYIPNNGMYGWVYPSPETAAAAVAQGVKAYEEAELAIPPGGVVTWDDSNPLPSSTQAISEADAATMPAITDGYATPGLSNFATAANNPTVSVVASGVSDADIPTLAAQYGATAAGSQNNSTTFDKTGLATDTLQTVQQATLEQIRVNTGSQAQALSNIKASTDNVASGVQSLPDRIAQAFKDALVPEVPFADRIEEVKTAASGRFPFGVVNFTVSPPSGGTYQFTDLRLSPTVFVPIRPFDSFGPFLEIARTLFVLLFWCGTILACIRKVDSL